MDEIISKATESNLEISVKIPYERSALLNVLYEEIHVISREEDIDGFNFRVSGKPERIAKINSLLKNNSAKGGVSDTLKK